MFKRTCAGIFVGLLSVAIFTQGCASKKPPETDVVSQTIVEEDEIDVEKQKLEAEKRRFEEEKRRLEAERRRLAAEKREMEERNLRILEEQERMKTDEQTKAKARTEALPGISRDAKHMEEEALRDVHFDYDKSFIREDAKLILRENSEWLMNNPHVKVLIEGHCDERGSSQYNLALGEKRALSLKKYFISMGIATERLNTISYGEELPVTQEKNEAGWAKNRRGHFLITSK